METDRRISRPHMFMDICEVIAKRSTCFRGNVGALIVLDNDPVAMGYNGPASGEPHCKGNQCELENGGCLRSIHAEANAISRVESRILWFREKELDLYCTSAPCLDCARRILQLKKYIRRVFYRNPYRLSHGIDRLLAHDLEIYRVTPAGFIIDQRTNEIVEIK